MNNQNIETNSQNQTTYAEVTKSHPPAGNNHKAANEIHAENNQVKCNKLSSGLTSDEKSFFLSGMDENVKESQIYSYTAKRNIDPIKISMFQSKRKGTVSAKIIIPSNCSEQV